MAPITLRSFMAARPPTRVGVVTMARCTIVSTPAAWITFTTRGLRMSARTYSVRSRSTSGSSRSTPTTYSTSASRSRRCASFPPRKREMPVIRTRCPTTSPYPRQDHRVAGAHTKGLCEIAAVHGGGEPSRGVHDEGHLSRPDVGERSGPAERDRPGLVRIEQEIVDVVQPGSIQIVLPRGELDVPESIDGEDGAPDLSVGDHGRRHGGRHQGVERELRSEGFEAGSCGEVGGGGGEHVPPVERERGGPEDDVLRGDLHCPGG